MTNVEIVPEPNRANFIVTCDATPCPFDMFIADKAWDRRG